jgi:hypothetical protein
MKPPSSAARAAASDEISLASWRPSAITREFLTTEYTDDTEKKTLVIFVFRVFRVFRGQ